MSMTSRGITQILSATLYENFLQEKKFIQAPLRLTWKRIHMCKRYLVIGHGIFILTDLIPLAVEEKLP